MKLAEQYPVEWHAWWNMRGRCRGVMRPDYKYYGGRGITVCKRWQKFSNFLVDMGPRPGPTGAGKHSYSLDRIDNSGNYAPSNCRWVSWTTQQNNKRSNIVFTVNGITKTITQWAKYLNINREGLYKRHQRGKDVVAYLEYHMHIKGL